MDGSPAKLTTISSTFPAPPTLIPGCERYVVRGGGSGVFNLNRDDRLEIVSVEAGQEVEVVVFGEFGKGDLGAIGLNGNSPPLGLQEILANGGEDAERVRFGLFRRGLDPGRVASCRIFGSDAAPKQSFSAQVERPSTLVVAVPRVGNGVWDQSCPTDVLVFIYRTQPSYAKAVLNIPDPLAEPRIDLRINIASAISFEVFEGEYIQIIDIGGQQCSDFLAFHRKSLDKGEVLAIDSTTTRTFTAMSCPKPGLFSKFYDRDQNPLVEIVQDTVGKHDMFALACTRRYYEDWGYFGHANCSDNLSEALRPYGIGPERGWPAINYFTNSNVGDHNNIWFDESWSRPGDYVLMRALSDLVCGASACPNDIDPANGWNLTEIQVRVYPKSSNFKRAIGYRMTPDSPLRLTQDTAFGSRTRLLTNSFTEYRGYWLPASYDNVGSIEEYWSCRQRVVIMDLSPLRKLEIMGVDAESLLNSLVPRDLRKLSVGQVVYTPICFEHGGMIDDGTIFRMTDTNFRWIGGDDASLAWIEDHARNFGAKVVVKRATEQIHNIAVQGPKSREVLSSIIVTPEGRPSVGSLGLFRFTIGRLGGSSGPPVLVSRTGYTGELGYEVFCDPRDAPKLWDEVVEAGKNFRISPFGMNALDIVRIEAGLVFSGYDFDSTTDPFEAGIPFTVPKDKAEPYVGKEALERRRKHPSRKLVGIEIEGNDVAVHKDVVFKGRAEVGVITSGVKSPLLGKSIALARVDIMYAEPGEELEVGKLDGRMKRLKCRVVSFPFYDPGKQRLRM